MSGKYPSNWFSMYGNSPINPDGSLTLQGAEWLQTLGNVSQEAFKLAINGKLHIDYHTFAPTAMQMKALCQESEDTTILSDVMAFIRDPMNNWWESVMSYNTWLLCDKWYLQNSTTEKVMTHIREKVRELKINMNLVDIPPKPMLIEEKELIVDKETKLAGIKILKRSLKR
jgi:hypothetical protein